MKFKLKILSALLLTALSAATIAQNHKNIEVTVDDDNGVITKHVIVNGVELDEAGIAKLEVDGDVKIINLEGIDAQVGDTMTLAINDGHVSSDNIEVNINTDDGKVTKTVLMNGKKLSTEEIAELVSSGKMNTFDLSSSEGKMIMIKTDDTDGSMEHGAKFISKIVSINNDDHATLGFVSNIKSDGWHVTSVLKGSGAEQAGLKKGDIIKFLGKNELSKGNISDDMSDFSFEDGEMVDLEVERAGKLIYMKIEASKNNMLSMSMNYNLENLLKYTKDNDMSGLSDADFLDKIMNLANVEIKVIDVNNLKSKINFDEFNINLPDQLGTTSMFITDGSSTTKLLGQNHEMTTISEGLSSYFGTNGGVLMMHVDEKNLFDLKDGDVIKSINGNKVESPKDVIKQLLKADKQHDIKLKIVRHKRNKTLKYNK